MPAEKRPADTQNDEVSFLSLSKLRRYDDDVVDDVVVVQQQQPQDQQQQQQPDDFSSNNNTPTLEQNQLKLEGEEQQDNGVLEEDLDDYDDTQLPQQEFVNVDLQTIRKEVQCPICLGIIKKTRTVMECLHRFCRECIDKSMRMGNNECPACRTHCASRRSLRDDPRYDALIAALYPDIKKFEEEELAFCEEDESRNKQIQESISQVLKKQSEVTKKRPAIKETASPSTTRNSRNAQSRRRRRRRRRNASADQNSDDDAHDSYMNFDPDEHQTEIKQMKGKSRASTGSSHSSPSATPLIGKSLENNLDQSKESRGFSPGMTCSTEMLAWGRGGIRSNTRNSNANGGVSRNARRMCLAKLVDFLRNLEENDEELDFRLMLISLDK